MDGLKTLFAVLAFAAHLSGPARAEDDLLRIIASCAGQLSAELEHQWLMGEPDAEATEARRAALLDILEALLPEDRKSDALNWRIEAKVAQAALLSRATFSEEESDRYWALRRARDVTAACVGFILS